MTITPQIYDTETLLDSMRQMAPVPNFWMNLAFGQTVTTNTEFIEFSKITEKRKIAPLVVPTARGVPLYTAAEKLFQVKPAYSKPKDAVTADRMIRRQAGLGELLRPTPLSPQERYAATVADILYTHRTAIERLWEWLAAKVVLDGKVTLTSDNYPTTVVDYERPAGHTVVLGAGARWGEANVSIADNIESWSQTMAEADFGGEPTDLILGLSAWKPFKANAEIQKLLDTQLRNTSGTTLDLGIGDTKAVQLKGNLSRNLRVWTYNDYYHAPGGAVTRFMDPRDILLFSPNFDGIMAFGGILDIGAEFLPLPIFPKMWPEQDPSATYVMSQSAPLPVAVNPACTFRARVVA